MNIEVRKCYAGKMTERWKGKGAFDQPVVLKPGRMEETLKWSDLTGTDRPLKPWLNGMPRVIFVGDMADVFSKDVPFEYLREQIVDVASRSPHIYMILTKQAGRMKDFVTWYFKDNAHAWMPNLWMGVSVTNQVTASRMDSLLACADLINERMNVQMRPKYFVSYEPALASVDFTHKFSPDLLIIGGESGVNHASVLDVKTVRGTIATCRNNKISPFVKQMGTMWAKINRSKSYKGGEMADWPDDIRVREMPR